ncbi:DNA-methyltransferase [Chondromyces apiculatus]|uniref:Methyltransferase n=1 Tax=Chondromyces apiculatus DSM 436 TaxID=1192034 RepID=A0A017TF11_9BACT|nr:site-specific DNA-methyltransferase [Chondromyces apiculatus]EYF07834.1 DNA methylase [Chondromyces apiculatus DSM 436]
MLTTLRAQRERVTVTMLDPWYNKGIGGERPDYHDWLAEVIAAAARISDHVFVWGFPEIVARQLDRLPPTHPLQAWLTWYFKNCPSVIRGWRSAQNACLHLARPDARLYPEHFLNDAQREKQRQGKLRYLPGPPSVIEAALIIGFIGRREQQGHPSQKPEKAIEPLLEMTTVPDDTVLDPMCGSGTTGAVCQRLGRRALLCDMDEKYVQMTERRLGVTRTGR